MNLKNRQISKEDWPRVSVESCDSLISTTALFREESDGLSFHDRPRPPWTVQVRTDKTKMIPVTS